MMKQVSLVVLLLHALTIFAQDDVAVGINELGKGQYLLTLKKTSATIEFQKGAETYRIDKFYLEEVNLADPKYNAEEGAVEIRCEKGHDGCFDRKLIKYKKRAPYDRLMLPVSDQNEANELIELLKKMAWPKDE